MKVSIIYDSKTKALCSFKATKLDINKLKHFYLLYLHYLVSPVFFSHMRTVMHIRSQGSQQNKPSLFNWFYLNALFNLVHAVKMKIIWKARMDILTLKIYYAPNRSL